MALRKIMLMHKQFGKCDGHTCRDCGNLIHVRDYDKALTKCRVYGVTSSDSTDWAQRWLACGMYNKQWRNPPVMRLIAKIDDGKSNEVSQIDGQLTMEV